MKLNLSSKAFPIIGSGFCTSFIAFTIPITIKTSKTILTNEKIIAIAGKNLKMKEKLRKLLRF